MLDKAQIFSRALQLLNLTYYYSEDNLLDAAYEEFNRLPGGEDGNVER